LRALTRALTCAGFIAGEKADAVRQLAPEVAVERFLQQLDAVFGSAEQPKPASVAYVKAHVFDW